jgi:hypothetical protein
MQCSLAGALELRAERRSISIPSALVAALAVPAFAHLVFFVWTLAVRARFPMDLEWLEGNQLYEAFRFAHGLPVYGPPSQGFVPSPYPPLYHLVVAALGWLFGFDYGIGRAVSDASIAAAIAVQTAVVVQAAPSRRLGWLLALGGAAGIAAMYRPLQASMDLARVDMMGFAMVSIAAFLARKSPVAAGRSFAIGAMLCAAVYTKQTNLFYAAWIIVFVARRDLRGAARVAAIALALSGGVLLAFQARTGGWFWIWMTEMRRFPLVPWKCAAAATVLAPIAAALGGGLLLLARRGCLSESSRLWSGMLAASIPACVLPTLTPGGWLNNLIGLTFLVWLVGLLLVCDVLRGVSGAESGARAVVAVLAAGLIGALYDPTSNVPGPELSHDAGALNALVESLDSDVLVPMYPFLAPLDGKSTPQVSLIAYLDAAGPGKIDADVAHAIREGRPKWVVLCGHPQEEDVAKWLGPAYAAEPMGLHVQALREVTGGAVTLLRRSDAP